jgi:hypothetical protein
MILKKEKESGTCWIWTPLKTTLELVAITLLRLQNADVVQRCDNVTIEWLQLFL